MNLPKRKGNLLQINPGANKFNKFLFTVNLRNHGKSYEVWLRQTPLIIYSSVLMLGDSVVCCLHSLKPLLTAEVQTTATKVSYSQQSLCACLCEHARMSLVRREEGDFRFVALVPLEMN